MRVYTNGGCQDYNQKGTLKILPFEVYFNDDSLANILLLAEVTKYFQVTMDSKNDPTIIVHVSPTSIIRFSKCSSGLYYLDTSVDTKSNSNKKPIKTYSFFTTVNANKSTFSRRDIDNADKVRTLQQRLGWLSTADLKHHLAANLLLNCPLTTNDIDRADMIYGLQVPMLRGKMVRQTQKEFTSVLWTKIPSLLLKNYPTDKIDMDFFFVNGNPFFYTKTKLIKFRAVQSQSGRGKKETATTLKKIKAAIEQQSFKITALNGDNEFEKLRDLMSLTPIHITA